MNLTVTLNGRELTIDLDGSERMNDRGYSDGSDPAALLEAFEAELVGSDNPGAWLDLLAAAPTPVVVWGRVLSAATANPILAVELGRLDVLVRSLSVTELSFTLASLVREEFPRSTQETRSNIEAHVLELLPADEPHDEETYLSQQTALQLLHALDRDLVGAEAGAAMDATHAPMSPRDRFGGPVDFDRHWGVDLTDPTDAQVAELTGVVERFIHDHLNSTPSAAQLAEHAGVIDELERILGDGYAGPLAENASGLLVRVAALWARCGVDVAEGLHARARQILLGAVESPRPEERDDDSETEGDLITIASGPRTDAARGLMALAWQADQVNDELVSAIETLARDPVMSIRCEVIGRMSFLARHAPDVAWSILRERAANEPAQAVLRQVVHEAWNLRSNLSAALDVLEIVASKATGRHTRSSATAASAEVASFLWVLLGEERAHAVLTNVLCLDVLDADAISSVLHNLRKHGCFTDDDPLIRQRVLQLCSGLVPQGSERIAVIHTNPNPNEDAAAWIREGAALLDAVASQLYFAVGVHDARQQGSRPPTAAEVRLVEEARDMLDSLAAEPIVRVAHHLVEIHAFTLEARPSEALSAMATVVTGGTRGSGYALESQAVKVLVDVVTTLLADHRSLFDNDANLTALRTILEVFIEEGTPDAHRLIYGIGQIFR